MTGLHSRPGLPPPPAGPSAHLRGIHLRYLARSDASAFVAAVKASRHLHARWVSPPDSPEEFRHRLPRPEDATRVSLIAVRAADEALLGAFNLSEIVRGPLQQAYLGYYAFAPHAGRGYMADALRLVLDHAFRKLGLHRVEANIQPGNTRSIALARSAGFIREGFSPRYLKIGGRWRDHERWAINADHWRSLRRQRGVQSA